LNFGKDKAVDFVDKFFVRLQNTTVWFTETEATTAIDAVINPNEVKCSGILNAPGCFEITD